MIQQQGMASCGCTLQAYACPVGKELSIDIFCGYEVINSSRFPARPVQEREMLLAEYQQAVSRYMQHCGYGFSGQGGNQ